MEALYFALRGQTLQQFVAKMICHFLRFYPSPLAVEMS